MIKTIGIVGVGVVGRATARVYMEDFQVRCYDSDRNRATDHLSSVVESDLVFVCVPEYQVEKFFEYLSPRERENGHFVIKSTVPVGTTRSLRERYGSDIIHSPEFLTERCAVADAMTPSHNIVGGHPGVTLDRLCWLYTSRFPGVPLHRMTSDESEMVKLFTNAFFATKVAFFNEVEELCTKIGGDWESVRKAMLSDGRIAHSHTKVPGPDGKCGYGGKCLPKDVDTLIGLMDESNLDPAVCRAARERNLHDRLR